MAKKKATMTLKDFHGGSIPSDLPLPSAPGVIVRPLDRQMHWGTTTGRIDHHKLRPGSAGASRNFDEKTPFLSQNALIGRNFDEDERKPLDGGTPGGPRRMVSDDVIYSQSSRVEPNSRPLSAPLSQISSTTSNGSYASRFSEVKNNLRVNPQTSSGNIRVNTNSSNVWGLKKEAIGMKESLVTTGWSAQETASKLVHASALDKISSGRWNSKQHMSSPTDGEKYDRSACSITDAVVVGDYKNNERVQSPVIIESHEKRDSIINIHGGVHIFQHAGRYSESEVLSSVASESSERPKLKLLPRSKPVESYEPPALGQQQHSDPIHLEYGGNMPGSSNPAKHEPVGYKSGDRAAERPKLNLKPRSQLSEQLNDIESKRNTVFGGARPREMVLKERGFDHAGDCDRQSLSRNKQDMTSHHATRYNNTESAENAVVIIDNNNNRRDPLRTDVQRRNKQGEKLRNNGRNSDSQERPPSPETWRRKPVNEQPTVLPSSAHGGARFGKVASAVELATAFSKSVSDPSLADRFSGQRNVPSAARPLFSVDGSPT
ncbi:unnamed protein product [Cuscuta epithymum]|uniref:Uncharacterized protein n=2 Tax=Cuscuta epithymum TaxID=186058 RepID=A0AAV0G1E5_9ASTE|nr:unnamed protein product [Cuscuta epithymum]